MRRRGKHRFLDTLESRLLLSGDVLATLDRGGNLVLTGDKNDNAISVSVDAGGGVSVASADGTTTINGATSPATLAGWTGGIRMRMGDGADAAALTGLSVNGEVRFEGGRGDNTLTVDSTTISRGLVVHNLAGKQSVSVLNSTAARIEIGNAQRGDTSTVITNSTIAGRLKINSKDGTDTLSLTGSSFGEVQIDAHKGDSTFTVDACTITRGLWFKSMQGADSVSIVNGTTIGGRLQLRTGHNGATLNLADLTVGQLEVATGKGNDVITLANVSVSGWTQIRTDKGDDQVAVTNGSAAAFGGAVCIDTGHGDDLITLAAAFTGRVKIHGGRGADTLDWTGGTFAVPPVVVQVESINPSGLTVAAGRGSHGEDSDRHH